MRQWNCILSEDNVPSFTFEVSADTKEEAFEVAAKCVQLFTLGEEERVGTLIVMEITC